MFNIIISHIHITEQLLQQPPLFCERRLARSNSRNRFYNYAFSSVSVCTFFFVFLSSLSLIVLTHIKLTHKQPHSNISNNSTTTQNGYPPSPSLDNARKTSQSTPEQWPDSSSPAPHAPTTAQITFSSSLCSLCRKSYCFIQSNDHP